MEPVTTCTRERVTIRVDDEIELRGVSTADCAAIYATIERNFSHLRRRVKFLGASFQQSDLLEFLRKSEIDNAARAGLAANIWFQGELCGAIGLHKINQRDRNSSIGYWLDEAYEGRGIMTRACRAMVTEGFHRYGLHRIEIRCATGNDRSMAIPRRLGFIEEGILREADWLHDHWVDLRVFSMLEQDWKRI